jgi:site-specific DNA recombinase
MASVYMTTYEAWRYQCTQPLGNAEPCKHPNMRAAKLDAAVWHVVEELLTEPEAVLRQLEEQRQEDPVAASLTAVEQRLQQVQMRQANAARALTLLEGDESAASPMIEQLRLLGQERDQLEREAGELRRQQQYWAAAQWQTQDLARWCRQVATNLTRLTYDERRLALQALGVSVEVFHGGHYTIHAAVPIVSSTNRSAARSQPPCACQPWPERRRTKEKRADSLRRPAARPSPQSQNSRPASPKATTLRSGLPDCNGRP